MRGDWVLFKNKVHSMGPPRCHAGHRHQILWPEVGPFSTISAKFYGQCWAHSRPSAPCFVGPFEATSTICYDQWWAHLRPSVQYFMASGGFLQGHQCHILWPVVGPSKAIG